MDFIPHKSSDIRFIEESLGFNSQDVLRDVPNEILLKKSLNLPGPYSEIDVFNILKKISDMNDYDKYISFLGAGIYDHYIPSVVKNLSSRSEFVTAYTPYQAEMSQGILQIIYEYQTCISRLTGMELSNASLYDGANALAEAVKLAVNFTKRKKVLLSSLINPFYIKILDTYFRTSDIEFLKIDYKEGVTSREYIKELCDDTVACIVIAQPNFFGMIEDIEYFSNIAKKNGALSIVCAYPISLSILKSPGVCGADVVVAEGQCLGLPISFGGSLLGIFATKNKYVRFTPGRIVGCTTDSYGKKGFVLTLQAREQHIRRGKALSNICSNHAWCALVATIYMSVLGDSGLKNVALHCIENAHYFADALDKISWLSLVYKKGFFNEFIIKLEGNKDFDKINKNLKENDIILGLPLKKYFKYLDRHWLVCVTEKKTKKQMDDVIEKIKRI